MPEFKRLENSTTRALWAYELSAETLKALAEARVDPEHDRLDALMDE